VEGGGGFAKRCIGGASKGKNGEIIVRDGLVVGEELKNIVNCGAEAGRDRCTHVDEHDHVERGFVGACETAEVADDAIAVDNREVGWGKSGESMVVLVGGEEGNTHFGDGTVERRNGRGSDREIFRRLGGRG